MAKVVNAGGLFLTGSQAVSGSFSGLTVISATNIANITFGDDSKAGPITGITAGTTFDVIIKNINVTGSVLLYK